MDPNGAVVHPESLRILNIDQKKIEKFKEEMDEYFKISSGNA